MHSARTEVTLAGVPFPVATFSDTSEASITAHALASGVFIGVSVTWACGTC